MPASDISATPHTARPLASWKVNHAGIRVPDFDEAIAWYTNTLDFRLLRSVSIEPRRCWMNAYFMLPLAAMLGTPLIGIAHAGTASATDRTFIAKVSQGGMFEAALGQLAENARRHAG